VLDLYAGSGALGLEALSRGARAAVFVDGDRAACEVIRANAAALELSGAARVECRRALDFLRRADEKFGWIFLDPPYAADELDAALGTLGARLDEAGVIVAEHEWRRPPADAHAGLALSDRRRYGQTAVSFFTHEAPK
jgi:16S rRNA (guanine(966)-N(2))-methyltransferase RsmD